MCGRGVVSADLARDADIARLMCLWRRVSEALDVQAKLVEISAILCSSPELAIFLTWGLLSCLDQAKEALQAWELLEFSGMLQPGQLSLHQQSLRLLVLLRLCLRLSRLLGLLCCCPQFHQSRWGVVTDGIDG